MAIISGFFVYATDPQIYASVSWSRSKDVEDFVGGGGFMYSALKYVPYLSTGNETNPVKSKVIYCVWI